MGLKIDGKPAGESMGKENNIARTKVDTTKRIKLLNTNITPMFLEYIRHHIQESEHWSWKYPLNSHSVKDIQNLQ